MRKHVEASTSEPDLARKLRHGFYAHEVVSRIQAFGKERRLRQKSSEPTIGDNVLHRGNKARRASVTGDASTPNVNSNRRRHSGIFEKLIQPFKRATVTPSQSRRTSRAEIHTPSSEQNIPALHVEKDKIVKRNRRIKGSLQGNAPIRVKSWVRTIQQEDHEIPLKQRELDEQVAMPSDASHSQQVLDNLRQTVHIPSEETLPETAEQFGSHATGLAKTTLAVPVLQALGLRPTSSSEGISAPAEKLAIDVTATSRLEFDVGRRQSSFSSTVSNSYCSSICIGPGSSKDSLLLDPIRTIESFVPIAVQPDFVHDHTVQGERKTKRKSKPANLTPLQIEHTRSASSHHSPMGITRGQQPQAELADSIGSSQGSLKRFSKSLASLGSAILSSRSNASLPMRVSGSVSSLAQYNDGDNTNGADSPRGSRQLMPRSFSRIGTAFRSTGHESSSSNSTFTRHISRSNPRVRSTDSTGGGNLPRTASMSSRYQWASDDVEDKNNAANDVQSPLSSTFTSPEKTSTSLPTQLATISPVSTAGRLAEKRSRSVDFNLNRAGLQITSKREYDRRKNISTHQVVETSTIYAMHESSHTLLSPLGEPEETQGKVNQYHIIKDIGSGAYGRVVLCRNEQDQRYYACKIISKSRLRKKFRWSSPGSRGGLSTSAESVQMDHLWSIKREVAILKKLSKHPNINALVEVLDDGKEDNLYMIFELCEYGPVMKLQCKESVNPLSEDLARKYFRDVVLGLEYLHYKRIIHRDLKPENLLLKAHPPDGVVQIADFGISNMFEDGDEEPVLDDKNASPLFCPPEACQSHTKQLRGYAVDIWALGVTLYCLVHGKAPWQEDSIIHLYDRIVSEPAQISESVSPNLRNLLERMLRKDPDERITLHEIKEHPWVSNDGAEPMLASEVNCVFEDVTEEEVENAFQPAMMFVTKIINRLKGKGKKNSRNFSAPPTPAAAEESSSASAFFSGTTTPKRPISARTSTDHDNMYNRAPAVSQSTRKDVVEDGTRPLRIKMRMSASVDALNRLPGTTSLTAKRPILKSRSRSFAEQGSSRDQSSVQLLSGLGSQIGPDALLLSSSLASLASPGNGELPCWPLTTVSTGRPDQRRHTRRGSSMNIIDEVPESS